MLPMAEIQGHDVIVEFLEKLTDVRRLTEQKSDAFLGKIYCLVKKEVRRKLLREKKGETNRPLNEETHVNGYPRI